MPYFAVYCVALLGDRAVTYGPSSTSLYEVSMSVPFALSSAVAYGAGDFAGGLAARRTPVLTVTAVAQAAGLVALVPAALL